MSDKKLNWYALSYKGRCLESNFQCDATTYQGFPDKILNLPRIEKGKDLAGVHKDSALIAATYLGLMTREEFCGTSDQEPEPPQ